MPSWSKREYRMKVTFMFTPGLCKEAAGPGRRQLQQGWLETWGRIPGLMQAGAEAGESGQAESSG